MVLAILAMIPLLIVAVFGAFLGSVGLSESKTAGDGTTFLMIAALCGLAVFGLVRWANGAKIRPIIFDDTSISFDGKTYLLEHVSSIGCRSSGGFVGGGSGMQGAMMMAGAKVAHDPSGRVYIQYGGDEVVIIGNLHPNNTQTVYNRIVGFLEQFGHKYRS